MQDSFQLYSQGIQFHIFSYGNTHSPLMCEYIYVMKSIYSYIDYRQFLSDYYDEKKSTTTFFSHRYFCNKAGISSPNFLKLVIDGKKNLSESSIQKFSKALELGEKEQRFFRNLVLFNQATNANQKQEYYAILLSMMNMVKEQHLSLDQHELYSVWYVSVIRELVTLVNFDDDYSKLATMVSPQISSRDARESVRLLLRLGLIKKESTGKYSHVEKAIRSDSEMARNAIRSFNRKMAILGSESIERFSPNDRNVTGITVGASKAAYDMIVAEMQACKDRIISIVNRDENSNRVYQVNFQAFPLSIERAGEGGKDA